MPSNKATTTLACPRRARGSLLDRPLDAVHIHSKAQVSCSLTFRRVAEMAEPEQEPPDRQARFGLRYISAITAGLLNPLA